MKPSQRLVAGVVALAAAPLVLPFFLPGAVGVVLLVVFLAFAMAMLGSVILSLGFAVERWPERGFLGGIVLAAAAAGAIQAIFGAAAWRSIDLTSIVAKAEAGGYGGLSPGLGSLIGPGVWNSVVLLIGMFILALPLFAVSALAKGSKKAAPPAAAVSDSKTEPPRG